MIRVIIFSFLCLYKLNADKLEGVSVQLSWKHQFQFAGFYMAIEKGFYKDLGLDVSLFENNSTVDIPKSVINKKFDFGIGGSDLVLEHIQNKDIILIMPFLQSSPLVIISNKIGDIQSIYDLKNKIVMLNQNQSYMASLEAMFKINGVLMKDFHIKEHSFGVEALINKKVDAMSAYLTNEPFELNKLGIEYLIFNPSSYGFNFYDDILFTSTNTLKHNPEMVEKMYLATKKGWEYAFNNIEETINIILKKYNTQNKTYEHLLYEAEELKKISGFDSNVYLKFRPDVLNQIIQTYNLLDFSKSKIDLDNLVYEKSIYHEEKINKILISKILLTSLILLILLYYWNRKLNYLNIKIKNNQEKISNLLNNSGQGFLIFSSDFKIDSEYSKECENLIGHDIQNKDVAELLFNDNEQKKFFKSTLTLVFNEKINIRRNSYLSLLPSCTIKNKKAVKIEYKILDNLNCMLILTNVTTEKKLENKLKMDQLTFKMIVSITKETSMFYDTIKDYEHFLEKNFLLMNLKDIYREVHTFKGIFSQFYMEDVVKSLHCYETIVFEGIKNKYDKTNIKEILFDYDLKRPYNQSKKNIEEILGADFFNYQSYLKIDVSNITELQMKISNYNNPECKEILDKVEELSKVSLYSLIRPYTLMINKLAIQFNKEVEEFIITGDKKILVKNEIKPFIKSLIHVIKNTVDHGIEPPSERLEKNKSEKGKISCDFNLLNNILCIEISDDGRGIDMSKVIEVASNKGIEESNLSEEILTELIFNMNFSTKDVVNSSSGRGIGLSVVKEELLKLNGIVNIYSNKDFGTKFQFKIPI